MRFAPDNFSLSHQKQGVEHDSLSEGDGKDRLDQNLRRGAGIPSHRYRRPQADQTNPKARAERRQTNVYAPSHMIPLSFPPAPAINRLLKDLLLPGLLKKVQMQGRARIPHSAMES